MNLALAKLARWVALGLLAVAVVTAIALPRESAVSVAGTAFLVANVFAYLYVILDPRRGGISLMVSFYFLFMVAIPARAQIDEHRFPFDARYRDNELAQGLLLFALAELAYLGAEYWADRRTRSGANLLELRTDTSVSAAFLRRVLRWQVALSLALAAYVGPGLLFASRADIGQLDDAGSRVQALFVARSLSLFAGVVAVYLLVRDPGTRRRAPAMLHVVTAIVCLILLNFPPGLARFHLVGTLLGLASVGINLFARRLKVVAGTAAPLALYYIFPALKSVGLGGDLDVASRFGSDVSSYLLRVDFDSFKQTVDAWIYGQDFPLRMGENFLGVALFWVPRSLWASKPTDSGELVSSALGYEYTNVSSPLPAEAYVSFGPIGVVIVFLLVGLFVAGVERRVRRGRQDGRFRLEVILYALVVGFAIIILRGSLNGVAPMFATAFLAYAVVALWHRRRRRRRRLLPPVGTSVTPPTRAVPVR